MIKPDSPESLIFTSRSFTWKRCLIYTIMLSISFILGGLSGSIPLIINPEIGAKIAAPVIFGFMFLTIIMSGLVSIYFNFA